MTRSTMATAAVNGIVVTDSKGGYDAVEINEGSTLGLSNIRTAVQAYLLKENFRAPNRTLKWIAGNWNLADALTKEELTIAV